MMDLIYYVGFYGKEGDPSRRLASQAAVDKMDYIADRLYTYDKVNVVSASQTTRAGCLFLGKRMQLTDGITLHTFASVGWTIAKMARIELSIKRFQLFLYLLLHCSEGSDVVVYHSLYIMKPVMLAHRLRRFRLILEVEEIYQDVVPIPAWEQKMEFKMFDDADAFMFSTEFLERKLNTRHKPFAIVYGNYGLIPQLGFSGDGLIHAVFGGNLEKSKGALLAAQAAVLLPDNFCVHIAGVGPAGDVQEIQDIIKATRGNGSAGKLVFEGELGAADYERLLQQCRIGICSQDPAAKYSETSFPSKVLNYLRHGLKVVSVRIPTIAQSAVAPAIVFYENNSPQTLADAIVRASQVAPAGAGILEKLDENFTAALAGVLKQGWPQ